MRTQQAHAPSRGFAASAVLYHSPVPAHRVFSNCQLKRHSDAVPSNKCLST